MLEIVVNDSNFYVCPFGHVSSGNGAKMEGSVGLRAWKACGALDYGNFCCAGLSVHPERWLFIQRSDALASRIVLGAE